MIFSAPGVGRPAQRADSGRGVVPGGRVASLGLRGGVFHDVDSAVSSCGPAQSDLRFGCVELTQGGGQVCPQPAHDPGPG